MSISPLSISHPQALKKSNVLPFKGAVLDPAEFYYGDIARSIDTFEKEMGLRNPDKGLLAYNIIGTSVESAKKTVQEKIESLTDNLYKLVYKDPMLKKVDNKRSFAIAGVRIVSLFTDCNFPASLIIGG